LSGESPTRPRDRWPRRLLIGFWAVLLLAAGAGGALLHHLGPPPRQAAAPATPPVPGAVAATPAPALAPRGAAASGEGLLEPGPHGPLPRVGAGGVTPIHAYGRSFDRADSRPRIALAIAGIGLSESATLEAIATLPPDVALIVSPYAPDPGRTATAARAVGFELLAGVPMEPANFPLNDPGPRALLTGAGDAVNADRLAWALGRFTGYVGVSPAIGGALRGERFAAMRTAFAPVREEVYARGLLYLDPRPGEPDPPGLWGRSVDLILDEPGGVRALIEERLARLETIAAGRGSAVALALQPSPMLLGTVAAWAAGLQERGAVLAPVSAVIRPPQETSR
jgi:polysaccharide deacetylase 2 family uncharacterized protein YibQ